MKRIYKVLVFVVILIIGYYIYCFIKEKTTDYGHKVVLCIPVYGQSLALGEEAIRITDFKKLRNDYDGRILTENLDYDFGYFEYNPWKKFLKKIIHYQKRSFELSVYGMAESLVSQLGKDTVLCVFPGGQGTTLIKELSRGTEPYSNFLSDIQAAYKKSKERGWDFCVPAICWMQGESDIAEYPGTNYKTLLKQFSTDIIQDIKEITHQKVPVRIICYQSNALTRAYKFDANHHDCPEMEVPQAQMELIRDDSLFIASGPTYPYSFVREAIHIDGQSQKLLGSLEAEAALRVIRKQSPHLGLIPLSTSVTGNDVVIRFNVPDPPLMLDTIRVTKTSNYGFSVINEQGQNLITSLSVNDSLVIIHCSQPPSNCQVRYAVNGESMKSGNKRGPRGNLKDSQDHWCYQFYTDMSLP